MSHRTTTETIQVLRDAVIRQRCGIPLPDGVELEQLLEDAADVIERLDRDLVTARNLVTW